MVSLFPLSLTQQPERSCYTLSQVTSPLRLELLEASTLLRVEAIVLIRACPDHDLSPSPHHLCNLFSAVLHSPAPPRPRPLSSGHAAL